MNIDSFEMIIERLSLLEKQMNQEKEYKLVSSRCESDFKVDFFNYTKNGWEPHGIPAIYGSEHGPFAMQIFKRNI